MGKVQEALDIHHSGHNCAQSVLLVFAQKYGLDREMALKVAGSLGGGFRCGEMCGAATGAAIVIGLNCGQTVANDLQSKLDCYQKTESFMQAFADRNDGLLRCKDLLEGYDVRIKADRIKAQEQNLFKIKCTRAITSAVELLEELGY